MPPALFARVDAGAGSLRGKDTEQLQHATYELSAHVLRHWRNCISHISGCMSRVSLALNRRCMIPIKLANYLNGVSDFFFANVLMCWQSHNFICLPLANGEVAALVT